MKEIIIRFVADNKFFENFDEEHDYWDERKYEVYVDGKKLEQLERFTVDVNTRDTTLNYTATKTHGDVMPDGYIKNFYKC